MTFASGIELPEAAIEAICRVYQVKELSLFGSAARGEMRENSDFDFLVDFLPEASQYTPWAKGGPCRETCAEAAYPDWRTGRSAFVVCGVKNSA